jgi:copper chaperone CopZ
VYSNTPYPYVEHRMNTETSKVYIVKGMSCGHCEAAVREEVEKVRGVETVEVDLGSKQVVVRGAFEDAAVRTAVDEAGYEAA